jgi:hypothetical protein
VTTRLVAFGDPFMTAADARWLNLRPAPADAGGMWTYVLRHRLLLRAIYARSKAA